MIPLQMFPMMEHIPRVLRKAAPSSSLYPRPCITSAMNSHGVTPVKRREKSSGNNVSFWLHGCCGKWECWALVNQFNHVCWMTAVTPNDRPKSVHNSCVIKVFGGVFMLSRCFSDCSVGVGVFVTGLSQISSLFSYIVMKLQENYGT